MRSSGSGCPPAFLSAIEMKELCEPAAAPSATLEAPRDLRRRYRQPYFTTDTAAALRAMEIHADVLLKATKVDSICQ